MTNCCREKRKATEVLLDELRYYHSYHFEAFFFSIVLPFSFQSVICYIFSMPSIKAPYIETKGEKAYEVQPTVKSYKNEKFLSSGSGRMVRLMCEFSEPQDRLQSIRSTVLFFGSARSKTTVQYELTKKEVEKKLQSESKEEQADAEKTLAQLAKTEWMCEWMDKVERLATMVAEYSKSHKDLINESFTKNPDYFKVSRREQDENDYEDFVVTTGGGPGFMEAANRGAASVSGIRTMGMAISLPFEVGTNGYVSDGLAFEFHYFFTRKFWMMYSCRAIVIAPGGVGTMDEAFELLTLKQTGKLSDLPVVLLCSKFWKTVINWQALADFGVVSQRDMDDLFITDSCEEAMEYIHSFYVNLCKTDV